MKDSELWLTLRTFLSVSIYTSSPFTKQINANSRRMRKRLKSTTLWLSGLCPISLSHCWALILSIPVSISIPFRTETLWFYNLYWCAPLRPFISSALRVSIIPHNDPISQEKEKKKEKSDWRETLLISLLNKNRTHRGWYSFIISTLAQAIYMFGFVQLIPQLIINYKLKSVAHMPCVFFSSFPPSLPFPFRPLIHSYDYYYYLILLTEYMFPGWKPWCTRLVCCSHVDIEQNVLELMSI